MGGDLPYEEYRRKFRVLDQMLTMHSTLRDRYFLWSQSLTFLILAASVGATAVAFLSGDNDFHLGSWSGKVQYIAGGLTVFIFLLALIELVTDWRRCAWAHDDAARRLGELKLRFRGATIQGDNFVSDIDLASEYERTMAAIVPIPDRLFLRLKAKHKRKIAVSQQLDETPGAPIWLLRLRLLGRDSTVRQERRELAPTTEPADVDSKSSGSTPKTDAS